MEATQTGHLRIVDSRTERHYEIPIVGNHIRAKDLASNTTPDPEDEDGTPQKLTLLDNGFENTACMESEITHIDGHRGQIEYRGIPIQDLFRDNDFEDVLHLLLWNKLPTPSDKKAVRVAISAAQLPPKGVINTISAFPRDSETYPMIIARLSAFVAADKVATESRHQHKPMFHNDLKKADKAILRTMGYYSTTIALVHCHKRNIPFTKPTPGGTLVGNLLLMMGIVNPATGSGPDPEIEACLSKLWILYADHEMTNSTAATLHAASTLTDPTSCVMAGLICGFGPLHGGAIDLAYSSLEMIKDPSYVPGFIEAVKAKKFRLYGYGHRIYKTRDPRLALIEQLIEQNRERVGSNPLLKVALAIDQIASQDEYFVKRNLKANADLLGCFLYSALGFEQDMITAIICLSRIAGGLSHWRETLVNPIKLWRPLQIYSGPKSVASKANESLSSAETSLNEKTAVEVHHVSTVPNGLSGNKHKLPFKLRMYLWAKTCLPV